MFHSRSCAIDFHGRKIKTVVYLVSQPPHKPLNRSLLLVNSKLLHPYYNSRRAHTVLSKSERVHQCKTPGFCYLIPYAWSEAPFDLGSPSFQNCVHPFNSGFTLRHTVSPSFLFPAWVSQIYVRNYPKLEELSEIIYFFPINMLRSTNFPSFQQPNTADVSTEGVFWDGLFLFGKFSQKAWEETICVFR